MSEKPMPGARLNPMLESKMLVPLTMSRMNVASLAPVKFTRPAWLISDASMSNTFWPLTPLNVSVQGRAEGEFRISGNFDVANGATVKALIEGSNVSIKGDVEGMLTARDKLTIGKSGKINGDITVKRLQIEDGASLNGHVRMGNFENG